MSPPYTFLQVEKSQPTKPNYTNNYDIHLEEFLFFWLAFQIFVYIQHRRRRHTYVLTLKIIPITPCDILPHVLCVS